MSTPSIRPATPADLPAVAEILRHYVRHTHSNFDRDPRPVGVWADKFQHDVVEGPYHLFVAERDDAVVGYANSSQFRPKDGYRHSAEVSVYLRPDEVGRGTGRRLYEALLGALATDGFHRAYAGIALPNDASIALHEALGFTHAGTFHEVGWKQDRWVDVAWYERAL